MRLIFLLFFVFISSITRGQLLLNEVTNNNDSLVYDEDGDASDFIELFYNGPDSVDLTDYFLSDKPSDFSKFQLPPFICKAENIF